MEVKTFAANTLEAQQDSMRTLPKEKLAKPVHIPYVVYCVKSNINDIFFDMFQHFFRPTMAFNNRFIYKTCTLHLQVCTVGNNVHNFPM